MGSVTQRGETEDRRCRELPRRVAHAIRTPLGLLGGVLDQLEREPEGEARAILFEMGARAVKQLGRLADRLGLLARLERGTTLRMQSCDLVEVLRSAVADIAQTRPRRRVTVDVTHADGSWCGRGDAELLRFAFAELIDNAVRFAQHRVTVDLEQQDGAVLRITNDGGSHPIEQEGSEAYRNFAEHGDETGLGIGLSVAEQIAALHGGQLSHVEDAAAGRVRFSLRLPWVSEG